MNALSLGGGGKALERSSIESIRIPSSVPDWLKIWGALTSPLRLDSPLAMKRWQSGQPEAAVLATALCCLPGPVALSPPPPLPVSLRPALPLRGGCLPGSRCRHHVECGRNLTLPLRAWQRGKWPRSQSLAQGPWERTARHGSSLAPRPRPGRGGGNAGSCGGGDRCLCFPDGFATPHRSFLSSRRGGAAEAWGLPGSGGRSQCRRLSAGGRESSGFASPRCPHAQPLPER
ncbi:hypothetical protein P7K49_007010 [Saguinus oedipus]|uniref:Uncharacterized protein n=1 Tax=Saguinus oedipus TaxID=9490 RepID=A0ABQ9W431_SAGOE|nr:hypothetical protein P7K49_007010 [Saguinus oedipus]